MRQRIQEAANKKNLRGLCLALLLLGSVAGAMAQKSAPQVSTTTPNQPQPAVATQPTISQPITPGTAGVAAPAYLTPISGLQGVLAETLDGATVASQSVEDKFNPASSVKLATALVALKSFGPEHRFLTSVWSTGQIDRATGTLNGDLVIAGRDPSFHYEHAVMLARELNQLGIKSVTGNLIVAPGFTMNFDWSARRSGEAFRDTLDAVKRSAGATRAWMDERMLLGD